MSSLLLRRRILSWSSGTASAASVLRSTPLKKRNPPDAGGRVRCEETSSSTQSRMTSCIRRPSRINRARNRLWRSLGTWIPILAIRGRVPVVRALPRAARAIHMIPPLEWARPQAGRSLYVYILIYHHSGMVGCAQWAPGMRRGSVATTGQWGFPGARSSTDDLI